MKNYHNDFKGEWAALLAEYYFFKSLREDTEWSYAKILKGFLKFVGEGILPGQVTQRDVLHWRRKVIKEMALSAHTWNNKVAHMRALFNFALDKKLFAVCDNPFNGVSLRASRKNKKTLTKEQQVRIYLVMQGYESRMEEENEKDHKCALQPLWFWRTVLDTLRYTGMRQNQLRHIRLRDVNLVNNSISLSQEGSKTHREWRIPVVSQLQPGLATLMEKARELGAENGDYLFDVSRLTDGGYTRPEEPVPMDIQPLRSFFRRLSRECGFAVSPHRFRHTLATTLMTAPERNLLMVQRILGHRSTATTMEYVELSMEIAGRTLEREMSLYMDRL